MTIVQKGGGRGRESKGGSDHWTSVVGVFIVYRHRSVCFSFSFTEVERGEHKEKEKKKKRKKKVDHNVFLKKKKKKSNPSQRGMKRISRGNEAQRVVI
jgi:hypothetical protein